MASREIVDDEPAVCLRATISAPGVLALGEFIPVLTAIPADVINS
jgi:hypothetical protein